MKDYYQILGVTSNSDISEIKTAYKKLSKKFHPDVNDGDKFFEEKFKEIQAAYELLSDNIKRQDYNRKYAAFFSTEDPLKQPPKEHYTKKDTPPQNNGSSNGRTYRNHGSHGSKSNTKQTSTPGNSSSQTKTKSNSKEQSIDEKKSNVYSYVFFLFVLVVLVVVSIATKQNGKKYVEVKAMSDYSQSINPVDDNKVVEYSKINNTETLDTMQAVKTLELYEFEGVLKYELFYGLPNFGMNPETDKKEYSYILELNNAIILLDEQFGVADTLVIKRIHVLDIDLEVDLAKYIDKEVTINCSIVPGHTGHHHAKAISWDFKNIRLSNASLSLIEDAPTSNQRDSLFVSRRQSRF